MTEGCGTARNTYRRHTTAHAWSPDFSPHSIYSGSLIRHTIGTAAQLWIPALRLHVELNKDMFLHKGKS